MPVLDAAGLRGGAVHIDPLVFPISVDAANGRGFLEGVRDIRAKYGRDAVITGRAAKMARKDKG